MKLAARWTLTLIAATVLAPAAYARDDRLHFPIKDGLAAAEAQQAHLNDSVKLFWGNQKFPTPSQKYGTFTSNKKSNGVGKSDEFSCDRAFLSAVLALQERAVKEGGNAVVNIKSVYKNDEVVSDTDFECGAGSLMAGVALRGEVVKLP